MTHLVFMWASVVVLVCGLFATNELRADFALDVVGVAEVEEFQQFRGLGFAPGEVEAGGQLDSLTYRAIGFSDGPGSFGGIHDMGDFRREDSTGGESEGGAYAFDVGGGDWGVGVQPTDADFTPGTFTIRVLNATGDDINGIDLFAAGNFFNDGDRSTRWFFELSLDDVNYDPFHFIDSPEAADMGTVDWDSEPIFGSISFADFLDGDAAVGNMENFYVRISGVDLAGSGARDEFALTELSITATVNAVPEPASCGVLALLAWGVVSGRRRRRCDVQ